MNPLLTTHSLTTGMYTLYESDDFAVVYILHQTDAGHPELPGSEAQLPSLADSGHQGFEIVDKRAGRHVYLDGSWAGIFFQHITSWQAQPPTQEEVEEVLQRYASMGQIRRLVH